MTEHNQGCTAAVLLRYVSVVESGCRQPGYLTHTSDCHCSVNSQPQRRFVPHQQNQQRHRQSGKNRMARDGESRNGRKWQRAH
jgi:hypothetical protein